METTSSYIWLALFVPEVLEIVFLLHSVVEVLGLKESHGLEAKHQLLGFPADLRGGVALDPEVTAK